MTLHEISRARDDRGFRDLDHDGVMSTYEDPSAPVDARVEDLLQRMTLDEKAGLLFHTMITMNGDGSLVESIAGNFQAESTSDLVVGRSINHFNLVGGGSARHMAQWHNALQELAASTRLGIPVTVSSDPRHHFTDNPLTSAMSGALSQWPETLGLAAIGDEATVSRFADVVRREYVALGIRVALHPQIDLATEPRWSRISGTFGEDPGLTSRLAVAYIQGLQGAELGPHSVAAMTKHFPGGGPQLDGEDAHFHYGREQVYPGGAFDQHLEPFRAAIAAGTSQMMPYYGMPVGTPLEEVGFGFNRGILTDLLRQELGFAGIICTDWGLVTDGDVMGEILPARAWGVEHLSPLERVLKILRAGADQLGGESCTELVTELVLSGVVAESRIDESARRILREKFVLGLFDDPFVNVDQAIEVLNDPDVLAEAQATQSRAVCVLDNPDSRLPLERGVRVYTEGIDAGLAAQYGELVAEPQDADIAIVRLRTPYDPRPGAFERFFHAGTLEFSAEELDRLRKLSTTVPTIIDVYLERPAIVTPLVDIAGALVVNFGANDQALLDALFNVVTPVGTLPFDLPRSMEDVRDQRSDVPFDAHHPVFRFGHGLAYTEKETR